MPKDTYIGLDINKDRNIIFDRIVELHKKSIEIHKKYRDLLGQFQELRRQEVSLLNKMAGITKNEK